jgi:heat shock protein HslJ
MKPILLLSIAWLAAGSARSAEGPEPAAVKGDARLAGTSWKLVRIAYGSNKVHQPVDPLKYTFAFLPDGRVAARIDCNRGNGTWISSAPGKISFGAMASTVMKCPPGSLDRFVFKDLPNFASYRLKDGKLFLDLEADGGSYEFAPHVEKQTATPTRKTFKVP